MKKLLLVLAFIACAMPARAQQVTAQKFRLLTGVGGTDCVLSVGTGSPAGVVSGSVCDMFFRTDGGTDTSVYIKESGSATTSGWVAIASAGSGVSGPGSSTNHNLAAFNGTGGNTLEDSGVLTANVVTLAGSQTLTNKVLTTPTIGSFTNATHTHTNSAGGGTLAEGALALTDITTNNSSTGNHGFLKKLDNNSAHFMDGQGNWSTPSGSGGGITGPGSTVSGNVVSWNSTDGTVVADGGFLVTDIVTKTGTQTLTNKTLTSPAITTPTGIVKGDVGLGNVDNTSDATKNSASVTLTNKTITAPIIDIVTGGTGTTSDLTLQTTTGNDSTGAGQVIFLGGNNGAIHLGEVGFNATGNHPYFTVGTLTGQNSLGSGGTFHTAYDASTSGGFQASSGSTSSGTDIGYIDFGTFGTASAEKRVGAIHGFLTAASGTTPTGELRFYTTAAGSIANWFTIESSGLLAIGGGTTSSFPALKRSSTTLQARLADDSAYAPIEAAGAKFTGTFYSPRVDDGNSGTSKTIDFSTGNEHEVTLTGNVTFTFSNPVDGGRYVLMIRTGAGSFTVTWPGTVAWPGGVAPTITATASKTDMCSFIYNSALTKYLAACAQNY